MCVTAEFRAFPRFPLPWLLLSRRKPLEENAFNLASECNLAGTAECNLIQNLDGSIG